MQTFTLTHHTLTPIRARVHASAIASRVLLLDLVSSISLSSWRLGALSFEILMLKPLPCGIHVRGGAFGGSGGHEKGNLCEE